jgi:group I intron endonuclease
MGYIYLITNKLDNTKYVGQTIEKDINERWKGHLKKTSNCRYLKRAFEKYGKDNFEFNIICLCFDNDCDKYEQEYMDKYNTLVPNGYNLRKAGNNGAHNEETKLKISTILKLRFHNLSDDEKKKHMGINNGRYGVKLSQEAKDNLSKKMKENWEKGVYKRENLVCRKKVNCYTLDNEFVRSYESITEAVSKMNISKPEISMCCNNRRKSAKGFIWKFN